MPGSMCLVAMYPWVNQLNFLGSRDTGIVVKNLSPGPLVFSGVNIGVLWSDDLMCSLPGFSTGMLPSPWPGLSRWEHPASNLAGTHQQELQAGGVTHCGCGEAVPDTCVLPMDLPGWGPENLLFLHLWRRYLMRAEIRQQTFALLLLSPPLSSQLPSPSARPLELDIPTIRRKQGSLPQISSILSWLT